MKEKIILKPIGIMSFIDCSHPEKIKHPLHDLIKILIQFDESTSYITLGFSYKLFMAEAYHILYIYHNFIL
jgi:hypothetical protein